MTPMAVQAVRAVPMGDVRIQMPQPAVDATTEVIRRVAGTALDCGINALVCLSGAHMGGLIGNMVPGIGSAIPTGLFLGAMFGVKKLFELCMAPCSQGYEGRAGGVTLMGTTTGVIAGLFSLDSSWPASTQRCVLIASSLAGTVFSGVYSLGTRK